MRKWVYGILGILMLLLTACSKSDENRDVIPNDIIGWWKLDHYNITALDANSLDTLNSYNYTEHFKFVLNADGTAQNYGDNQIYHYTITKDSFIYEGIKSAIEVRTPSFMLVCQTFPIHYSDKYKRDFYEEKRFYFVKMDE